jgi:flagellar hook assembly protein FlgD
MKRTLAAAAASLIIPAMLLQGAPATAAVKAAAAPSGESATRSPALKPRAGLAELPELKAIAAEAHRNESQQATARALIVEPGATITSPISGANVAGDFEVNVARGDATNVTLWLDGVLQGTVAGTDASVIFSLYINGTAAGETHLIEVGDCTSGSCPTSADGTVTDSASVVAFPASGIDVTSVSSSGYFSPDGDGTKDTISTGYTTVAPGVVTVTVVDLMTLTPVLESSLGTKTVGSRSFVWNGKGTSGTVVQDGNYRISLTLTSSGGSASTDSVDVVVDKTNPSFSSISKSVATVFPRKDGYRDSVTFYAKVSENVAWAQVKITTLSGKTVRTLLVKSVPAGRVKLTWNGRYASGTIPAAGTYRYRWSTRDLAGNYKATALGSIKVDKRILSKRTRTQTVTPVGVKVGSSIGSCASLVKNPNGWTGAHGYRSKCDWVAGSSIGQVWVGYKLVVPKAVKYGSVKVGALGKAHPFTIDGYSIYSTAGLNLYGSGSNDPAASKIMLSPYKYYWTGYRSFKSLGLGRTVVWDAGTNNGNRYDVRRFKVRSTYYVLVK